MMDGLLEHAARPASEVEWEDLLLRLEIAPRVARNELDEPMRADAACRVLAEAVARELEVGGLLEAAAGLPRGGGAAGVVVAHDPVGLAHRFAALRARTFAMVQRRGLEVWEWTVRPPRSDGEASVHQLLRWLVDRDGELLAALRAVSGSPARC